MAAGEMPFTRKGGSISSKLEALSQGRPEGNWISLTDPHLKHAQAVKAYSPLLQDLLTKLLDPNPLTRITAADALLHPWVRGQECGPASPPSLAPARPGDSRARTDSFLEDGPVRMKKAPRTIFRQLEREVFIGTGSRSTGAATCAAAVGKIKKIRIAAGASEGDVDALADPEHQLVDFILSDDAETCRLALISLTTKMNSLQDACNFIYRIPIVNVCEVVPTLFHDRAPHGLRTNF